MQFTFSGATSKRVLKEYNNGCEAVGVTVGVAVAVGVTVTEGVIDDVGVIVLVGVTEEVGKSLGWSPATTFAASTLLSGGTEGITNLAAKELKTTAKLIGSGYFNSAGGILNNLGNLGKTNKDEFVKEAAAAQEKAFGKRIMNYTAGVIGNEKQNATKALLFDKYNKIQILRNKNI